MSTKIKDTICKFVCWLADNLPGGWILWAVMCIFAVAVHFGGVIASAVVTGVAAVLSFLFIFAQLPEDLVVFNTHYNVKKMASDLMGNENFTSVFDLVFTVSLTAYGFHVGGVTMATAALCIGLAISAALSYFRDKAKRERRKAQTAAAA